MLLGLHGFKTSGKDAFYQRALVLADAGQLPVKEVRRVAFADKLYESAAGALGVTVEQLLEWKNDPKATINLVAEPWSYQEGKEGGAGYGFEKAITFRQYLQFYGTEAHREVFGDSFWVDQVLPESASMWASDLTELVCVTDVRFPNEAQRVRDRGGHVVKIQGPPEVENRTDMHASENPLSFDMIDFLVLNTKRNDNFTSLDDQIVKMTNFLAGKSGMVRTP